MLEKKTKIYVFFCFLYLILSLVGVVFLILSLMGDNSFLPLKNFKVPLVFYYSLGVYILSSFVASTLFFIVNPKVVAINILILAFSFHGSSLNYKFYLLATLICAFMVIIQSFKEYQRRVSQ
jgi:hypothetical protein